MTTNRFGLGHKQCLSLSSAITVFLAICFMQSNAFAQSSGNGSVMEVVPSTSLSALTSGPPGSFFLEAPVFLGDTVNRDDCTVDPASLSFFLSGGRRVGIMRIWGMRLGTGSADTSSGTGVSSGTGSGTTSSASNLTGDALAAVNISLDLLNDSGTLEMQGTLGRIRQEFQQIAAAIQANNSSSGDGQAMVADPVASSLPLQDVVAIT